MIKVKVISEIVGSPEEHVNKTLMLLLDKIKERKEFSLTGEKTFEAQKIPDKPLYSAFIEYILEFKKIEHLHDFCFDFMPSSIELLEPDKLSLDATELADFYNDILARLHKNDMFLRNVIAELALKKNGEKRHEPGYA